MPATRRRRRAKAEVESMHCTRSLTTVTMPMQRRQQVLPFARRKDIILFEEDHESELNFSGKPLPALKSLDTDRRVIYLGSLSKTLAHGLRIGFTVGPSELVADFARCGA